MKNRVAIIGSADLAQAIAHHAKAVEGLSVAGFFDDFRPIGQMTEHGPVLGPLTSIDDVYFKGQFDSVLIGIGYRHLEFRWRCFERLKGRIPLATLVHPSCYVDRSAEIEPGVIVFPCCVLDQNVRICNNAVLNTGCIIAHDSTIGANSFLGPGVAVAGFVRIGRSNFVGIGSVLIDNVHTGDFVQTGGNTTVIRSLEDPGLYVGSPARFIRKLSG